MAHQSRLLLAYRALDRLPAQAPSSVLFQSFNPSCTIIMLTVPRTPRLPRHNHSDNLATPTTQRMVPPQELATISTRLRTFPPDLPPYPLRRVCRSDPAIQRTTIRVNLPQATRLLAHQQSTSWLRVPHKVMILTNSFAWQKPASNQAKHPQTVLEQWHPRPRAERRSRRRRRDVWYTQMRS